MRCVRHAFELRCLFPINRNRSVEGKLREETRIYDALVLTFYGTKVADQVQGLQ